MRSSSCLVSLPLLMTVGCFAGPPDVECSLIDDIPCPPGSVCVDFACLQVCNKASDCNNPAEACINEACKAYSAACDDANPCVDGFFCDASSACRRMLEQGAACDSDAACILGSCRDGVCCDGNCAGTCEACAFVWTGVVSGMCAPIPPGEDPGNECGEQACSGERTCYNKEQGIDCVEDFECASGFCTDRVCCSERCDGFCRACTAVLVGAGDDGVCGLITGGEDPQLECEDSSCNGEGGCVSGAANGVVCGEPSQCASGFCVDGVCCDTACDSGCEACASERTGAETADGICTPTSYSLDPDIECSGWGCDGSGSCNPPRSWTNPVLLETDNAGDALRPRIGVDGDCNAVVAWVQDDGEHFNGWSNRYSDAGGLWEGPMLFESGIRDVYFVQVGVHEDGEAFVLWSSATEADGATMTSKYAADTSWLSPMQLSEVQNGLWSIRHEVQFDDAGNAMAAWQTCDHFWGPCQIWTRRYADSSWGDARRLDSSNTSTGGFLKGMFVDDAGNAVVAWTESPNGLRVARYEANVGWGPTVELSHAAIVPAALGGNAQGEFVVAWPEDHSVFARRYLPGAGWGNPETVHISTGEVEPYAAAIAADGTVLVVGRERPDLESFWSMFGVEYKPSQGWSGEVTILDAFDHGNVWDPPKMATDRQGNALVLWREDGERGVWFTRYVKGQGWDPAALVFAREMAVPSIAMCADGRARIVWQQMAGSRTDIWASLFE